MTRPFRKYSRFSKVRRRRSRKKKQPLQPLTPEAHAALLAARAQAQARQRAFKKQFAAQDAMYRSAAVLEGERRVALRKAAPGPCAEELTTPKHSRSRH